jgi:hypothetical protein
MRLCPSVLARADGSLAWPCDRQVRLHVVHVCPCHKVCRVTRFVMCSVLQVALRLRSCWNTAGSSSGCKPVLLTSWTHQPRQWQPQQVGMDARQAHVFVVCCLLPPLLRARVAGLGKTRSPCSNTLDTIYCRHHLAEPVSLS